MEEGVTIDLGVDGHTLVVEAGEDEGVYLGDFNIDKIRAYRERETWGNAYRKTGSYGPLTSLDVQDPFIRPKVR